MTRWARATTACSRSVQWIVSGAALRSSDRTLFAQKLRSYIAEEHEAKKGAPLDLSDWEDYFGDEVRPAGLFDFHSS